jgi:hypothetical protein
MTATRLEKYYAGILAGIFGLIVLHAPISVGFGVLWSNYDLLIKSWKEILMIVAVVMALIIVTRRGLWRRFLSDPLFYVIAAYGLLHGVLAVALYQGVPSTLAGMAIDLRYVLFFCLVYVLLQAVPRYRRLLVCVGIIGAFIVTGFAALQWFLPPDILRVIGYGSDSIAPYLTVDENQDYVRINSTLRGPNPLGAYASVVVALLAAAWARGAVVTQKSAIGAGILAVCGSMALWQSYSRSAWLAAGIAVVIVFVVAWNKRFTRATWAALLVVALVLGGTLVAARDSSLVSNVFLHENPSGGSEINSNEQHAESLENGFARMIRQPFGGGIGSTGSASLYGDDPVIIENQYLFVAHETGWLGLGLFVALFVGVLRRAWQARRDWLALGVFASGVALGVIGLFQPVWVDDTVAIVWWGLAAIVLAKGGRNERTTKQKTA